MNKFNSFINSLNKEALKEYYNEIEKNISVYTECDRVISNDHKLSKRFDFSKYIRENTNIKSSRDIAFSLCEMIDTYNIPLKARYNIALENVQYAYYINPWCISENKYANIVNDVTDYFLLREAVIDDDQYRNIKLVLKNNQFLNPEDLAKLRIVQSNDNTRYIDKIEYIKNNKVDSERVKNILDTLKDVSTELQAAKYIRIVYDSILRDDTLSDSDKSILKNSINMIPLICAVDKLFIDYEINKLDGSLLSTRDLLETVSFINETIKDMNDVYGEYYNPYNNILESYTEIGCMNIHDYIEDFKINQDKSPERFIRLLANINPNNDIMCELLVQELPDILDIIRYTYLYQGMDTDAVFQSLYDLIERLLNQIDMSTSSYRSLLSILMDEKKKIIDRCSSLNDGLNGREAVYNQMIDKCINKTNLYIDSYKGIREYSMYNMDNLSFEESVTLIEAMCNSMDDLNKLNKEELLSSISDNIRLFTTDTDNLRGLSNLILVSKSVNPQEYSNLLRRVSDNSEDPNERSIITAELAFIDRFKVKLNPIMESVLMIEANEILREYFLFETLDEATGQLKRTDNSIDNKSQNKKPKINFNDLQLALKAFGEKVKNVNGKVQMFWKNVDMYSTSIVKNMQKALTSDRREAIIKGSIIPSMSKCIKSVIAIASTTAVGSFMGMPYLGVIAAIGAFASSKYLNARERNLIYDEIDTELKVVEKEIEMALNDGDTNKYRFLLNYQKKLYREKSRIKYGAYMKGRPIPVEGRQ